MVVSSLIVAVEALFHCGFFVISAAGGGGGECDLMPPRFRHASLLFSIFNSSPSFLSIFPRLNTYKQLHFKPAPQVSGAFLGYFYC